MDRFIVLDRDGVINQDSDAYVKSTDEWRPIDGSIEAIADLSKQGFKIIVITNQSGVGRGYFSLDTLKMMHQKMIDLVEKAGGKIAAIYCCPHAPDQNCDCRKPKTGLFEKAEEDFKIKDWSKVYAIGDSFRDLEAACAIGAKPTLVKTGKGSKTVTQLKSNHTLGDVLVFDDLKKAAEFIKGKI